jgi:NAD(P)-dependent dehydrogenase (short-subunit alcohol dehydrogenase family)
VFGILPKLTSYSVGKGATFALLRCLAAESAELGILVNGVAPRGGTRMVDARTMSIVTGIPEDQIAASMPSMPPELTSPAVLYLAHESCTLNGEVLASGGGQVQRIATLETQGITRPDLTPEDIAEHIDAILDLTDAFPLGVGFGLTAG